MIDLNSGVTMQRIPMLDAFGTPRRMGIIAPPDQQVQGPPTPPRYDPITAFRFEIMDADGNPIPGAAVSIYLNDEYLLTPAVADVGGNVAVSVDDIDNAYKVQKRIPKGNPFKLSAVIQASGYGDQKLEIANLSAGEGLSNVKQRYQVTLQKAEGSALLLPILGIAAVIGTAAYFIFRK